MTATGRRWPAHCFASARKEGAMESPTSGVGSSLVAFLSSSLMIISSAIKPEIQIFIVRSYKCYLLSAADSLRMHGNALMCLRLSLSVGNHLFLVW
uniref:Uncharacterized protein n=1 Tax=Arundo donax TaxID=35708 RepID=A0A0A9CAT8_ARUDO